MTRDASKDFGDTTVRTPSWYDEIGGEGPKPYETKAWVSEVVVLSEEEEEVEAEEEEYQGPWWESLLLPEVKPYETAAWTVTTSLVAEEEVEEEPLPEDLPPQAWWETLGGEGPKPYEYAAWTFSVSEDFIVELITVSGKLFAVFDETTFDRQSLGVILNSGYFSDIQEAVYDEAYYEGADRGILVKRTLSKMMIYDSRASEPGSYSQIIQPLGVIATDPSGLGGYAFQVEPRVGPITEIISDSGGDGGPTVLTDGDSSTVYEVECEGEFAGDTLEAVRTSTPEDDTPPGRLLGTLSYETFNGIITITDWEHYNWEDDTPVLKAVQTLLSKLPDCISEVKVLTDPTAFWTSLGFKSAFKGDPYIHYFNR